MAVKSPISHRQRQAQATREAVAGAARRLFSEHGYVATTIEAVSDAAQIPVPTIYSSFGTKAAILEEVRRIWIANSNVEELHGRALADPNPQRRLRLVAHWTRRQFDLGYDVITVYQEAARTEKRVASVWRHVMKERESAIIQLIDTLKGALRGGLTPGRALDLYVAITLPEVYRTLVTERGWSSAKYQQWLGDLLIQELLGR